jgi:uncharacterized phage protein (TIGR02218 family)
MPYDAQERSSESGQPIELYTFNLGGTLYTYTNQEQNETYDAVEYIAETISRTRIESTFDNKKTKLTVTVPVNNAFAQLFVNVIPGQTATLELRQVHRTDGADQLSLLFKGRVGTIGFSNDGKEAKITCRPILSAQERPIPRHTYQGVCNHMLYDERCGILEGDYQETGTVSSASGRDITVSGISNLTGDYWEAGFARFGVEYRLIVKQSSATFRLNLPFANDPTGSSVVFLPGCKHTRSVCNSKYSNIDNYGGFPFVPTKNPFETGLD